MSKSYFGLWYEPDEYESSSGFAEDFCNVQDKMKNGKVYAMNVWSYSYFDDVRNELKQENSAKEPNYILPPDLFVSVLNKSEISRVIDRLIKEEEMRDEWLVSE